jgi:acetyl-CoA carboxylase carboxyl transferase subunit alpha
LIAFETAVFSVIAPEGAAEILWKDAGRASEAARLLKIGAHDLETLGIADSVVGGSPSADSVRRVVTYHLDRMGHPSGDPSPERRLRWRNTW